MGLERYTKAQERDYAIALSEIKSGRKRSHWMWYIFPQIAGLGMTDISKYYAIKNIQEAVDFLMDKTLGFRLVDICNTLLGLPTNNVLEIFSSPDYLKLKASMTLFDAVPNTFPIFGQLLDKFYQGERDPLTLAILNQQRNKA